MVNKRYLLIQLNPARHPERENLTIYAGEGSRSDWKNKIDGAYAEEDFLLLTEIFIGEHYNRRSIINTDYFIVRNSDGVNLFKPRPGDLEGFTIYTDAGSREFFEKILTEFSNNDH